MSIYASSRAAIRPKAGRHQSAAGPPPPLGSGLGPEENDA